MKTKIDELMALADDYADWAEAKGKGHPTYAESRQALQSALETALKPGEPVAKYIGECPDGSLVQLFDDLKKGTELYTSAPPAQTKRLDSDESRLTPPPRLSDEQISGIAVSTPPNVHTYGRAIEAAVRRQFGYE